MRFGVSYGARSHFYLTQSFYRRFAQVKIPADTVRQTAAVKKKIQLLRDLENGLKPIIRYDDGEQIIASLTLTARANQEMAKAIYQAPVPKGLDKKGRAQYKEGLKQIIEPYIKEAIKSCRLVLKKSFNLKVYSESVKSAYDLLASIRIKEGKFQQFLPSPVHPEVFPLRVLDDTGAVTEGFLETMTQSLKYGLSQADFEKLAKAMASRREGAVLQAVSAILNKDIENVPAVNSLAFFYLKGRRPALGELILNRLSSKKQADPVIMNNLAVIALRRGDEREAVSYLKKALKANSSYSPGES